MSVAAQPTSQLSSHSALLPSHKHLLYLNVTPSTGIQRYRCELAPYNVVITVVVRKIDIDVIYVYNVDDVSAKSVCVIVCR